MSVASVGVSGFGLLATAKDFPKVGKGLRYVTCGVKLLIADLISICFQRGSGASNESGIPGPTLP